MPADINNEDCIACGICIDVCPEGALTLEDVAVVDTSKCSSCSACVDECPNGAIEME